MSSHGICRIGVFYDGSFFTYSQNYFYHERQLGWLDFKALHHLLQEYVRTKEQGFNTYKVVYAAWYQGLFTSASAEERQLRRDRNLHHDLLHAGIDSKHLPMSTSDQEKGVDVALAVDALQVGLNDQIDIAVLVTGDGDLLPLVRALNKNGIRVLIAYFSYESESGAKSFANDRLLAAANYEMNINSLEDDKEFRALFKALFRKPEKPS